MGFINFHNHSEYSFLSSLLRVDELVGYSAYNGYKGCCLTDTLSTYGFFQLTKYCEKEGLKPVYGLEAYVHGVHGKGRYPIRLIALNHEGIEHLFEINSLSHTSYKETASYTLPLDAVLKNNSGLAILVESEFLHYADNFSHIEKLVKIYRESFQDRFYVEANYTGKNKIPLLKKMINTIEHFNLKAIAACEARYPKESRMAFDFLNSYRQKSLEKTEMGLPIDIEMDYSLHPKDDFYYVFRNHLPYIDHAEELLERIDAGFDIKSFKIPVLYQNADEKLRALCEKAIARRKLGPEYNQRLVHELSIIGKMGLADYFLMSVDLVRFMKEKKIPYGFGRGSSVSSLVLYLVGLTKVDPVENKLLFERFLNPDRAQLPDIDIDVCWKKRKFVFEYLLKRWGKNNAARLATIDRLMARSVIREIAKTYKLDKKKLERLSARIPFSRSVSLKKIFASDANLSSLYSEDPEIHEFADIVLKIEGTAAHSSVHAGGIIIAPEGIKKYASIELSGSGEAIAQLTKDDLEDTGFIKLDILGLRQVTIIDEAMRMAGIQRIDYKDKKALELLSAGDTVAVFQLESQGMRDLLRKVKPDSIRELSDVIALYRPGPIQSGMTDEYIRRKDSNYSESDANLASITGDTYGLFVYQEQILRFVTEIAGLDWATADRLRKALSSKNSSLIVTLKDSFIEGCAKKGISREQANRLFGIFVDFGSYSFNKSHSFAYAYSAFTDAYLKTHHPLEFYTASLNNNIGDISRLNRMILDIRFHREQCKISILPISINKSGAAFIRENGNIRAGIALVKYVGGKLSKAIVKERKANGHFQNLLEFYTRMKEKGISVKSAEFLIKAGAFDEFGIARDSLLTILPEISKTAGKLSRASENSLFTVNEQMPDMNFFLKKQPVHKTGASQEPSHDYLYENEATDLFLTHHPLDQYLDFLKEHSYDKLEDLERFSSATFACYLYRLRTVKTKSGQLMASGLVSDRTGMAEVVIFPSAYARFASLLKNNQIVLIQGNIKNNKIFLEQIFSMEEISR